MSKNINELIENIKKVKNTIDIDLLIFHYGEFSKKELYEMNNYENYNIKIALSYVDPLPEKIIRKLEATGDEELITNILLNENLPEDLIYKYAQSANVTYRKNVVRGSTVLPLDVVILLSCDKSGFNGPQRYAFKYLYSYDLTKIKLKDIEKAYDLILKNERNVNRHYIEKVFNFLIEFKSDLEKNIKMFKIILLKGI